MDRWVRDRFAACDASWCYRSDQKPLGFLAGAVFAGTGLGRAWNWVMTEWRKLGMDLSPSHRVEEELKSMSTKERFHNIRSCWSELYLQLINNLVVVDMYQYFLFVTGNNNCTVCAVRKSDRVSITKVCPKVQPLNPIFLALYRLYERKQVSRLGSTPFCAR